jgi:serine/threonine protein kinase
MLMPRATGGCMINFPMSDAVSVGKLLYRLFKGVHYMHSLHILHGDLKPGNVVLLNSDACEPHPVIIDFGHAANLDYTGFCDCKLMTCAFSSPELLALKPHSLSSDIWSLGATVYFMIARQDLLSGADLEAMKRSALRLRLHFGATVWGDYPSSLQVLLGGMLCAEAEKRFTIGECLQHRFFIDLLGSEWMQKEDKTVKLISRRWLEDELIGLKKAFRDQKDRHRQ